METSKLKTRENWLTGLHYYEDIINSFLIQGLPCFAKTLSKTQKEIRET